MSVQAIVLDLIRDDRPAYRLDTATLEQVLAATIGTTHGRKSDDPLVYAVERLRRAIVAVLQARRRIDAEDAKQAQQPPAPPAPPPVSGGQRVPRVPPPPPTHPHADTRAHPVPVDLF